MGRVQQKIGTFRQTPAPSSEYPVGMVRPPLSPLIALASVRSQLGRETRADADTTRVLTTDESRCIAIGRCGAYRYRLRALSR